MSNIGDLLALQCQGNSYKIAKYNERQRFNETADTERTYEDVIFSALKELGVTA